MNYKFNPQKNAKLIEQRKISFEDIINAISEGKLLGVKTHQNLIKYPNQKILFVGIGNEVYAVPCIFENDGTIFLKTIFPSRKARKEFIKNHK